LDVYAAHRATGLAKYGDPRQRIGGDGQYSSVVIDKRLKKMTAEGGRRGMPKAIVLRAAATAILQQL